VKPQNASFCDSFVRDALDDDDDGTDRPCARATMSSSSSSSDYYDASKDGAGVARGRGVRVAVETRG